MACIFCKIVNGEIPSKKIYEDNDVVAFLDISQASLGHTLVVAKEHYANLLEIEDYEYLRVMQVAKDLAKPIMEAFNASGVNILNNCNEVAGQSVMHFHVHIIPRYENDNVVMSFTENTYDLDEVATKIKAKVEALNI